MTTTMAMASTNSNDDDGHDSDNDDATVSVWDGVRREVMGAGGVGERRGLDDRTSSKSSFESL